MRYIPYLQRLGIDVSFCAQEKLHTLIKCSSIHPDPLTPKEGDLTSEGKWIPLISIPGLLNVSPNNPIINQPYISTTHTLITKWKNKLSQERRPIIGINWQGNPNAEKNNLKGRSLPLKSFENLAKNDKNRKSTLEIF